MQEADFQTKGAVTWRHSNGGVQVYFYLLLSINIVKLARRMSWTTQIRKICYGRHKIMLHVLIKLRRSHPI